MTGASPSGRSYLHYKVLLEKEPSYLQVIHGVSSMALSHGIILNRWQKTFTTLIEKDDEPRIHRMRTIHIIETVLQLLTKKVYAQRMIFNAEGKQLIGGRKK